MSDTIPEWALKEARAIMTANGFENASDDTFVTGFVALAVLARDERAAKIEREACAKIAERRVPNRGYVLHNLGSLTEPEYRDGPEIASAIRDRSKT